MPLGLLVVFGEVENAVIGIQREEAVYYSRGKPGRESFPALDNITVNWGCFQWGIPTEAPGGPVQLVNPVPSRSELELKRKERVSGTRQGLAWRELQFLLRLTGIVVSECLRFWRVLR